jgi:hypothetical protein
MEFADQGGLNQATSWVSGNAGATATETPTATPEPAPQQQQTQTQDAQPPAGDPNPAPAAPVAPAPEDLTPYRELVDNLGGLDGARQFDQLYKALLNPSQDFGEIGQGINKALQQLLGGEHYGALAMALHGEFGELLAEQFIADHPEWLQGKVAGLKPAEAQTQTQADDDDYGDTGQPPEGGTTNAMTPREKELTDRLAQVEGRLNEMNQAREQTAEQRFKAGVEKEVFGSVVDKTFAQLEGWEDAEMQQVVRHAMSEFSYDQKAKEAFTGAANYMRTKQPLLASQVVKAQNAFQQHLKNAMELVDLKRQAARKAAAPVEPERKEFAPGAPAQPDTRQQPTNREQNAQFWNVNDLTSAVQRRLQERGVPTA